MAVSNGSFLQRPPRTSIILVIIVLLYFGYHHLSTTIGQTESVRVPDLSGTTDASQAKDGSKLDGSLVDFDGSLPTEAAAQIPPPSSSVPTDVPAQVPTDSAPEWSAGFPSEFPAGSPTGSTADWPAQPPTGHPTPALTQPLSGVKSEFVQDAHKIQSADEFLPHLKAVTELPGMTMAQAKEPCDWPVLSEVNFQYSDNEWVKKDRDDLELEYRRNQWHDFMRNELIPYAPYKDRFKGRGIVIVAGNRKSMKRVRVILRQLKRLGSQMPIEIHYWDDEMNEAQQKEIASMWPNMSFNDLSSSTNILKTNHDGVFINYQLKTAAIINSRFAEPLLLDSDNIPMIDPADLYETDTYKEFGTLFWPDIARTRPNNPMWAITNTACRKDEYEQESGQMIVDKRRFFYHLQLASWFNNVHADYYNEFLLGDKDMFRFSFHALKTRYGFPRKWITSVGTLNPSSPPSPPGSTYYCGHTFAQHSPNNSIAFLHGGLIKTIPKEVLAYHRAHSGGIFQVYKRSEYDEQHIVNVNVGIKWDGAEYLPDRPKDLPVAHCTDFFEVEARPLEEVLPDGKKFQTIFDDLGGYWMLDD